MTTYYYLCEDEFNINELCLEANGNSFYLFRGMVGKSFNSKKDVHNYLKYRFIKVVLTHKNTCKRKEINKQL